VIPRASDELRHGPNVALSNLELPNPERPNSELPNAEPNLNTNQEAGTLKIEQRRFHHRCISQ
jgi:hypothetical protein